MKRLIFFAAFLFLLLSCLCCAIAADKTEGDWQYEVLYRKGSNPEVRIKRYNPPEDPPEVLTVPDHLGGYPVCEIGPSVFENYRNLEGYSIEHMAGSRVVILPGGLTKIEPGGFDFDELKEIRIENNEYFEAVDGVLFEKKTHKLLAYPLGKEDTSYTVPEGTEIISRDAFDNPVCLKKVTLAESVRVVEEGAFKIFGLHLDIPESIERIDPHAILWADEFTSASPRYQVINEMLIDMEKNTLLSVSCHYGRYDDAANRVITVPEGVETIAAWAFYGFSCYQVNFPSTLKSIREFNRFGGPAAELITFPEGLQTIGNDCEANAKTLVFPSSLRSIGNYCFSYQDTLESVVFREGIRSIGYHSFCNNQNLSFVFLPDSLSTIGKYDSSSVSAYAFLACPELCAAVMPDSAAEHWCKKNSIPYQYAISGPWQVDPAEAEDVLSLSGADHVLIRLEKSALELTYDLEDSPHLESFPIEWKNGRICLENGYMEYEFTDMDHLTLKMNMKQLNLIKTGESL